MLSFRAYFMCQWGTTAYQKRVIPNYRLLYILFCKPPGKFSDGQPLNNN